MKAAFDKPLWNRYLSAGYESWHFGAEQAAADELADLTAAGVKRATASLALCYELEGERLPAAGDISVVLRWNGEPAAVIETVSVEVVPFRDVTEDFAACEGEGDGSLAYWRAEHRRAFSSECRELGIPFSEELEVVCQRFRRILP